MFYYRSKKLITYKNLGIIKIKFINLLKPSFVKIGDVKINNKRTLIKQKLNVEIRIVITRKWITSLY